MTVARRSIHLIGLPTDRHSSFARGPAQGPEAIRAALASEHWNPACENGLEMGHDFDLQDLGDLDLREDDGDDERITRAVAQTLAQGRVPLLLGGDHSVTYPVLRAIATAHGPVEILHFDAHPDLYDELDGDRRSHATPFARIMEDGLASRLVQVGIRTMNRHQREQVARFGVEVVEMKSLATHPLPVLEQPLYISIDLDAFDPAFAPGVSHHEPGGLTARQVIDALLAIRAPIVGADVVELNPTRDHSHVTAVLAAKLVKELAGLIASNSTKAG
jgi:arginase